jgi:hypothetical protein
MVAIALALTACGSDAEDSADPTTAPPAVTAPVGPGTAYIRSLDEATRAMVGVAAAALDPGAAPGARGPRIEAELLRLEAAAEALAALSLADAEVDAQRADVVVAVPLFIAAMRDVVAAGEVDPVNGGLELVQRRDDLLSGVDAVLAADAGAIRALGDEARAVLTDAQEELRRQLDALGAQAAG